MLRERSGAIVNVSSVAAIRYTGYPYVAYYAAKAAVNNFTMGLALQYANEGIRVNAIIPGLMNTPLIHQQISGQYKDVEEMVKARDAACPMGRMVRRGISPRLRCSSLPTTRNTSPASVFRSDGGLTCRAA
jgi:NAD(P)-dependent dehydrogenase (short-subunit alcohol dehydrogenase family)